MESVAYFTVARVLTSDIYNKTMNSTTQNITQLAKKFYVAETTIFLALTLIIPALVHQIPNSDSVPIGAKLLPIFYAPLVATILFHYRVGLFIGLAAPLINYSLFGKPALPIVGVLSLELVLFVSIIAIIYTLKFNFTKPLHFIIGALGYLIAKLISSSVVFLFPSFVAMEAKTFLFQSVSNAWLGLIFLIVISTAITIFDRNRKNK